MPILLPILKKHNYAKRMIRFYGFVIIISLVTGCSTSKKAQVPMLPIESQDFISSQETYNGKRPVEIKNSLNDTRPDWTHNASFEKGNTIYFTGGFLKGADYSVSLRCANAEAIKSMVQAVSQYIRAEFSMFTQGSNNIDSGIDRYIQDGIATFTRDLHIQGTRQTESYYEEMYDPVSQNTFYNAWVKLKITKADYLRAKANVVKKLRDDFHTVGEIEAKEKAQELLKDLKGQVSEAI